jgi:transposase-like protein
MPIWKVECPNCGAENQIPKKAVVVYCGVAKCTYRCVNCKKVFKAHQEYWRWLGLAHGPTSP